VPLFAPPPLEGVPAPREWPMVGSLPGFANDPVGLLRRYRREHGDLVQFTLADHRVLMLSHPDLIDAALVGAWRSLHKDAIYAKLRPLLGEGLVTAEGEAWRQNRKLAAPSFTPRQIDRYAVTMRRCAERWVDGLPAVAELDLHHEMMALTQAIVLETLFGDVALDVQGAGEAIEVVLAEFVVDVQGRRRLWPEALPSRGRRRASAAIATLRALIDRIIAARRAMEPGDDLLSQLLLARDDEGRGMRDAQLRDEVITMFAAGHETTAVALTFALLLLSAHPEEQERLAADPARANAVTQETLRVLPPVWAIGRETQEPITLGGHTVPAGIQLLVAPAVLHLDERWFPDPERFWPDRWATADHPRLAYMPFGAGPRVCIGNHFALREIALSLQVITQRLQIQALGPVPPPLLPSVTWRPVGAVPVRLTRRVGAPR